MKIKTLFVVAFITVFSSAAFAQSVNIAAKKVVYRRTNPEISDYRKEFEITYPIITSPLKASTKRNLKKSLSYWRIFKTPFKEHFESGSTSSLGYKIIYNKKNVLAISFIWEGVGAYPDSATEYLVINLKTGKPIEIIEPFKDNSRIKLLTEIRKAIRLRESESRKGIDCFAGEIDTNREAYPEYHLMPEKINYKDLSGFFVTEKGVTFLYDYNFAHRAEACEPEKEYFFNWSKIKPFIRQDSLLARFVR